MHGKIPKSSNANPLGIKEAGSKRPIVELFEKITEEIKKTQNNMILSELKEDINKQGVDTIHKMIRECTEDSNEKLDN